MQNISDLGTGQGPEVIQGQNDPLLLGQTGKELCQGLRGHGSKVTELQLQMPPTPVTDIEAGPLPPWYSNGATPVDQVLQSLPAPSDQEDHGEVHRDQRGQG